MRCTLVCDCGRPLDVDLDARYSECPDCHARYAVTVTQIRRPSESSESSLQSD